MALSDTITSLGNAIINLVDTKVAQSGGGSSTTQNITTINSGSIALTTSSSIYKHTPSAATTYSFNTSGLGSLTSKAYTFELLVDMSNSVYTLTFPSNLKWQNNETPDLTSIGTYFFAFRTIDGGTTWLGNLQGSFSGNEIQLRVYGPSYSEISYSFKVSLDNVSWTDWTHDYTTTIPKNTAKTIYVDPYDYVLKSTVTTSSGTTTNSYGGTAQTQTINIPASSTDVTVYFDTYYGSICVLPDTLILMADGTTKEAKDVVVGDFVQTYNETTKGFEPNKVLQLFGGQKSNIVKVSFDNGKYIELTTGHPFLTENGWASYDPEETRNGPTYTGIEVNQLEIGDKCMTSEGTYATVTNIEEENTGLTDICNFDIENTDTFIGNGFVLHNES